MDDETVLKPSFLRAFPDFQSLQALCLRAHKIGAVLRFSWLPSLRDLTQLVLHSFDSKEIKIEQSGVTLPSLRQLEFRVCQKGFVEGFMDVIKTPNLTALALYLTCDACDSEVKQFPIPLEALKTLVLSQSELSLWNWSSGHLPKVQNVVIERRPSDVSSAWLTLVRELGPRLRTLCIHNGSFCFDQPLDLPNVVSFFLYVSFLGQSETKQRPIDHLKAVCAPQLRTLWYTGFGTLTSLDLLLQFPLLEHFKFADSNIINPPKTFKLGAWTPRARLRAVFLGRNVKFEEEKEEEDPDAENLEFWTKRQGLVVAEGLNIDVHDWRRDILDFDFRSWSGYVT
jgi:hypothetical protein